MNEHADGAPEKDQACAPRAFEVLEVAFKARRLGLYEASGIPPVNVGTFVVVSVERGEDMGRVVAKYTPLEALPGEIQGTVIRQADGSDRETAAANSEFEARVLAYCRERVRIRKLEMKLTGCEVQLDRRKVRIYFTAEQRTDFRALVRDMAAEFRARIEMRQIGVRDEARHRDGTGICGLRLCCSAFLRDFASVTLKSLREQNLAPNPSKVSGACSRLMCCLAYESEFYRRASRLFPEPGSSHRMDERTATVESCDIFHDTVTLSWERGPVETMDIAEFLRRRRGRARRPGEGEAWSESDSDAGIDDNGEGTPHGGAQ